MTEGGFSMHKYYGSKVFVLSFALLLSGCGLFGKEKLQIDGERIDVIKESSDLRPDYDLKQYKIRLPQPYENTRWAQNGGNTLHLMGHLEARESLNKLWEESFGKGSSKRDFLLSTPVISNKVVFNIDREAVLSARLLENGKEIWHKRLKPLNKDDKTSSMKGAGLAEFNKKIYATTGFGYVFCVNMVDGEILWQKDLGLPIRIAPTVSENKVFVQTFDNTLVALDAVDGSELWKYKTDFDSTTLVGGAAPAYNPELDVVIAAFSNGELRAFKASTGTPLWGDMLLSRTRTNSLSNITAIKANPVIDGDKVFAVGNNSVLVAIDLRTGRRLWERELHQKDFLNLRLGVGREKVKINIDYPQDHFKVDQDLLDERMHLIIDKNKEIEGAPITQSFIEKNITAIIGNYGYTKQYIDTLILQMVALHSYQDLKIIIMTNEGKAKYWEYMKLMPHNFNRDKTLRFFSTNFDDSKEISTYLQQKATPEAELLVGRIKKGDS